VYHALDQAIGYVSVAFPQTALVTLFSSPGVEASVYVFGPNIFTTAYGEGGGVVRISAPQGVLLSQGDTVVLPALGASVIGTMHSIQSVPTQPEQYGYVTQTVPLQAIRTVTVDTSVKTSPSFDEIREYIQKARTDLFKIEVPQEFISDGASASSTEVVGTTTTGTTVTE